MATSEREKTRATSKRGSNARMENSASITVKCNTMGKRGKMKIRDSISVINHIVSICKFKIIFTSTIYASSSDKQH